MSVSETAAEIRRAVDLLLAGELVALPTETVYGLGADAKNPAALAKIFRTKGRPADHPLIVHLPGDDHLEQWAIDIPSVAWELSEQFWPGPLTLILKRHPDVPDAVTGGQDTVGLRVPGHPMALALLREFAAAGGSGGLLRHRPIALAESARPRRNTCGMIWAIKYRSFWMAAPVRSASNPPLLICRAKRPPCCVPA